MAHPRSLSELLSTWPADDVQTMEALLPWAYDELRNLAHRYLRNQRKGHTLQSTALVHEAYLRLANQHDLHFENEKQFFGLAALIRRHAGYGRVKEFGSACRSRSSSGPTRMRTVLAS